MGNILKKSGFDIMLRRNKFPIVVILGCTGTGKSKLAIELANKFNGEIISADSMQVYKGLDIITNKVTVDERKEAMHHCIDFLDPLTRYTVVDFRNHCLPILYKIIKEEKLPIIVGGTNYYIESLLWEVLIKPEETQDKLLYESDFEKSDEIIIQTVDANALLKQKITQKSVENVSSSILYECLREIDPAMANAIHPGDRRKVIRSLQVYQQTGYLHSVLLEKQRKQDGGSSLGGPLRFKNTLMLWLNCDKTILDTRLDERVDKMLEAGLISELINFHTSYNETRKNNNYTEGIFQSIGFKEFHDYLILSEEERLTTEGKKKFEKSVEEMKIATRQYARRQTKWIVNRFLKKPDRQLPPVYDLSATNLDLWQENVLNPAIEIVSTIIQGNKPSIQALPVEESEKHIAETHYCEICERIFVGRRIWEIHLNSKKHSKRKAGLKKLEEKAAKKIKGNCEIELDSQQEKILEESATKLMHNDCETELNSNSIKKALER